MSSSMENDQKTKDAEMEQELKDIRNELTEGLYDLDLSRPKKGRAHLLLPVQFETPLILVKMPLMKLWNTREHREAEMTETLLYIWERVKSLKEEDDGTGGTGVLEMLESVKPAVMLESVKPAVVDDDGSSSGTNYQLKLLKQKSVDKFKAVEQTENIKEIELNDIRNALMDILEVKYFFEFPLKMGVKTYYEGPLAKGAATPAREIWNLEEDKKATLKEGVTYLMNHLKKLFHTLAAPRHN